MGERVGVRLPIASIEGLDPKIEIVGLVKAAAVNRPTVGIGSRAVEALYAADPAEHMLCDTGVERVARQLVGTLQKTEPRF